MVNPLSVNNVSDMGRCSASTTVASVVRFSPRVDPVIRALYPEFPMSGGVTADPNVVFSSHADIFKTNYNLVQSKVHVPELKCS